MICQKSSSHRNTNFFTPVKASGKSKLNEQLKAILLDKFAPAATEFFSKLFLLDACPIIGGSTAMYLHCVKAAEQDNSFEQYVKECRAPADIDILCVSQIKYDAICSEFSLFRAERSVFDNHYFPMEYKSQQGSSLDVDILFFW